MRIIAFIKRLVYNGLCVTLAATLFCAAALAQDATPAPDEYVVWLLDTARAELGYKEESNGATKYGRWAGNPTAQWCAEFLCWCVDQVDIAHGTSLLDTAFPLYSGQNAGRDWFIQNGRYISRTGKIDEYGRQWLYGQDEPLEKNGYVPEPGDYVFFTFTASSDTDHVALLESVHEDNGVVTLTVIEGNNPDSVQRGQYLLDDWRVLGFGTVHEHAGAALRRGCKGKWVLDLQNSLVLLGYLDKDAADGLYGSGTIAAVKAFQAAKQLEADGVADMSTQQALLAAVRWFYDHDPNVWLVVDSPEP